MSAHGYTVWIYKSSATDLSTAGVAYSFSSQLASVPEPSGPIIRPLEGRAEAQPWGVSIVDAGSTVTGILSDSTGRFHLMNRILAVRRTVDASTAAFLGVGRISDVSLNPNVAAYDVTVDDEHRLARITDIFTTNTTRLLPGGPNVPYGPFLVPDPMILDGSARVDPFGAPLVVSTATQAMVSLPGVVGDLDALISAVTDDRVPWTEYKGMYASSSAGNYSNLRLRVWDAGVVSPNESTDYTDCPVIGFPADGVYQVGPASDPSIGLTDGGVTSLDQLKGLRNGLPTILGIRILVNASTTVIPQITYFGETSQRYAMLHAMGKPPSDVLPLHIGGMTGQHPAAIAAAMYGGTYSTSGAKLPRYSTAAMDTWQNDSRFPLMRFRVTESHQPMARWLEDNVYAPNMVVPVTDNQGRIAPATILQPQSTAVMTYTFTGANLRTPHPGFSNSAQDQVTVANYVYPHEMGPKRYVVWVNVGRGRAGLRNRAAEPSGYGGDLLAVESREINRISRSTIHGRQVVSFAANGWHTETLPDNPSVLQSVIHTVFGNKAHSNANFMGGHLLDRFADGAVMGMMSAMSTAESVQAGDYVTINLESYPNAETQTRGGTRVVQILSRKDTPQGPIYQYLDAGPSAQLTTAPTGVTLAAGPAGSTKHSLNVSVGGIAGRAYVQVAFGSTRPPDTSTRWAHAFDSTSTSAYTVNGLPANSTAHARASNVRARRFASTFVYSTKRATASLAAPTSFAPSSVGTKQITMGWQNNEALPVDLFLDPSTTASFTSTNRITTLTAGANSYKFAGLSSASTYLMGVRHRDIYGGVSAADTYTTWTGNTTGGLSTSPNLTLSILLGGP